MKRLQCLKNFIESVNKYQINFVTIFVCYILLISQLLVATQEINDGYFTNYATNFTKSSLPESCKIYQYDKLAVNYLPDNKYRLWPNLVNKNQLENGKQLFGFDEAMDAIWKNQNPENCSDPNVKFLVSNGYASGFGSRIHVEGSGLTTAMNLGRVYLMHYGNPGRLRAHLRNIVSSVHCRAQHKDTLDCYYIPWSKCSLADAGVKFLINAMKSPGYDPNDPQKNIDRRTLLYHHGSDPYREIPTQFNHLLSCSPFIPSFQYYWWRAITATYLLRPNNATIKQLEKLDVLKLGTNPNERCISIYIRHGDKHIEMELVQFQKYIEIAMDMWKKKMVQNTKGNEKLVIFLGTENPKVLEEADIWSKENKIPVKYTKLFDREKVSASLESASQKALRKVAKFKYNDLEYLSILLNLQNSLKCDAWVCTLASNTCRIIDELRATIGGKANYHSADLSKETCGSPPCYDGFNNTSLDW